LFVLGLLLVSQFSVVYSDDCFHDLFLGTASEDILSTVTADIDGDGDMDIVVGTDMDNNDNGLIEWYENTNGEGLVWTKHAVATSTNSEVNFVFAVDIDGDGHIDIVSSEPDEDKIIWHRNNGGGSAWTSHAVTTTIDFANSVIAADIDGDGYMDLAASSKKDENVMWYRNTNGDGTVWEESVVAAFGTIVVYVVAADFDGDGDMDLASAIHGNQNNKIFFHENLPTSSGVSWATSEIASDFAENLVAADIDDDGVTDLVASGDDTVWHRYGSSAWTRSVVVENFGEWVSVADFNNDGYLDIVVANSFMPTMIKWYGGDGGTAWDANDLSAYSSTLIVAADFTGGGSDLLATNNNNNNFKLYSNVCNFDCSGISGTQILYESDGGNCNRFDLSKLPALKDAVDSMRSSFDGQCVYTAP